MATIPAKVLQAHRVRGSKRRGRNTSNRWHAKLLLEQHRAFVQLFTDAMHMAGGALPATLSAEQALRGTHAL